MDGHCFIVPIQHHLTMLEGDDDVWDEVRVSLCWEAFLGLANGTIELYEVPHAYVC